MNFYKEINNIRNYKTEARYILVVNIDAFEPIHITGTLYVTFISLTVYVYNQNYIEATSKI